MSKMAEMKLRPMGDRILIQGWEEEKTTSTGIILPGSAKEKPQIAEVVAVGPGGVVDGKEVKMELKAGDKIIVSKYAGNELKMGDKEYVIVRQSDVLAVVE